VNDSFNVRYNVIVDSSIIGNQTATNSAHIQSMTIDQAVTSSFIPINSPVLSITKTSILKKYYQKDTITYTLSYANLSTQTLSTGTEIIDTIPVYLTYVSGSASSGGVWNPAPAPRGRVIWNIGNLPAQTQASRTFKAVIDNIIPTGTVLNNSAHLFNLQESSVYATKRDTVYSGTTASLNALPVQMAAGDSVSFILTDADLNKLAAVVEAYTYSTHSSKGEEENLTFTETGVNTGIFTTGIRTIFGVTPGVNNDYNYIVSPGDTIFATYIDSLTESGDSARINTWMKIIAVDFSSSEKSFIDLNGGIIVPKDTIHYNIAVRNSSLVSAPSVTVHDTIPSGLSVVSGSITGGGTLIGNIITFPTFLLPSNDSMVFSYHTVVDTTAADNSAIENKVLISGSGAEQVIKVAIVVSNKPVMTMIKNVTASIVMIGDTVEYTINYTNIGTGIATNVVVTDTIPPHTGYVPQSVMLNGAAKTDQTDGDEVECDGIIIRVALQRNLQPGAGGILKYRVRVQ
jgi:uncharacterized repeat protein (TIGR01451 family)